MVFSLRGVPAFSVLPMLADPTNFFGTQPTSNHLHPSRKTHSIRSIHRKRHERPFHPITSWIALYAAPDISGLGPTFPVFLPTLCDNHAHHPFINHISYTSDRPPSHAKISAHIIRQDLCNRVLKTLTSGKLANLHDGLPRITSWIALYTAPAIDVFAPMFPNSSRPYKTTMHTTHLRISHHTLLIVPPVMHNFREI